MTPSHFMHTLLAILAAIACPNYKDTPMRLVGLVLVRVALSIWCMESFGESAHEIAHLLLDATRESLTG
jgi:hypothetical protein